MLGGESMIRSTIGRLGNLVPPERSLVATTALLAEPIAKALPELSEDAILIEPCKRDTAPAIGLAAMHVVKKSRDGIMAVMPSDHVIRTDSAFQQAVRLAASLVEENPKRLITFGIRPSYPAESFGYIERSNPLTTNAPIPLFETDDAPGVYEVKKFHEKPKVDVAQTYLEQGGYYWNSGIFIWRAQTILDAIAEFQPEMYEHLATIGQAIGKSDYQEVLQREIEAIKPISIDLGVMEHISGVVVIEAPFEWDDVGSWRAIERLRETDEHGNVIDAARHISLDTTGTIIRSTDPNHVVVTMGVEDLIVIVTPDATLVANKKDEESIRQVTKELADRGWKEYL
jgi:mannose-1-phosphate guanylyltransferase